MGDIRLVVQGDDLGMCRAVNEGMALATTDGILTQTSVMAPTPWFGEGAAIATRLGLAVGLHVTLTCEWEYLRWGPLTAGPSLRGADGTLPRTLAEATAIDTDDAVGEALAQADRAIAAGLALSYVDPHMGITQPAAYAAVCERHGVKFMYRGVEPHHEFASIIVLSLAPLEDRAAWFADRLDQLEPGTHMVMAHPGVEGGELRALTDADADNAMWAEPYRVADLAALCDPAVRDVVERRGIDLVAVRDL
ncbi:MAG: ChbG/HpnK family deacetylase [Actinomycetota bacterium]|nr:ChbG/HpnK family deacetylase [Actinomycetota bacterium]